MAICVVIILFLVWENSASAEDINYTVKNCTKEKPISWSSMNLNVTGTGIRCHIKCSPNCTCTLEDNKVTSNCWNSHASITQFFYPDDVQYLSWSSSRLHRISPGAFERFGSTLEVLHLRKIEYLHLQPDMFAGLTLLKWLFLEGNTIGKLVPGNFNGLRNLKRLFLNGSRLHEIVPGALKELDTLEVLNLNGNGLQQIVSGTFIGLGNLKELDLSYNSLSEVAPDAFEGLGVLEALHVDHNRLHEVVSGTFTNLTNLRQLYLQYNELLELVSDTFQGLNDLEMLDLNNNNLHEIMSHTFQGLVSLESLNLGHNQLRVIHVNSFEMLEHLFELFLSFNELTGLHPGTFQNQTNLSYFYIDYNNLKYLPDGLFTNLKKLIYLDLRGNYYVMLSSDLFTGLNNTVNVLVTEYASCCLVFESVNCFSEYPSSAFITCKRLLPYDLLRILTWFLSILGIVGNVTVWYTRYTHMSQGNKVQLLLITNLSISDFIMAVYLLIILSADLYFRDDFPLYSDLWRYSWMCWVTGALSVLSSEASAFFILVISIDRYLGITYPFGGRRLGTKSARWVIAMVWLVALGISFSTFVIGHLHEDTYYVSEVCVGLPITRKKFYNSIFSYTPFPQNHSNLQGFEPRAIRVLAGSASTMYLSTAIFTGLNMACFIVVAICYLALFISARKTTRKSGRSVALTEELRMAMKMSLIVFTDFCCWVPIGILSILVQINVVIVSPTAYMWIAIFVLPINSTINPFLYTLSGFLWDKFTCPSCKCQKQQGQEENIEMRVIPG